MYGQLERMFMDVLHEVTAHLHGDDKIRIVIHHDSLADPIIVSLRKISELTVEDILATIENTLNSNQNLKIDGSFRIDVGTIKLKRGGARLHITSVKGQKNSIKLKTSMVHINNADNMCMARAIGVSWANACRVSTDEWHAFSQTLDGSMTEKVLQLKKCPGWYYSKLRDSKRHEQTHLAETLCARANVDTQIPASLNDIPAFEAVLGIDIAVISSRMGNRFLRVPLDTDEENQRQRIYLYFVETDEERVGHFHAITKIAGFFSSSYFCNNCLKPYSRKGNHACKTSCNVCMHDPCALTDSTCVCISCHMTCRSEDCLQRHLIKNKKRATGEMLSQCDMRWKCTKCNTVINKLKRDIQDHNCGEWKCTRCQNYVIGKHLCYQRALARTETSKFRHIYFDFECRQDDIFQCLDGYTNNPFTRCTACQDGEGQCHRCKVCTNCHKQACGWPIHTPNLVVAQTACQECYEAPIENICGSCGSRCDACSRWDSKNKCFAKRPCPENCGKREVVFKGDGTAVRFGKWLFSKQHQNSTVLAHNMKGYDGYFLLDYLVSQSIHPSAMIYNGSKIMFMQVSRGLNIRILDSLNFLNMPLAGIPKSFGLEELKKGFFCHYWNRKENENYIGPMPEPQYYGAEQFSIAGKRDFDKWYQENKNMIFDMQKEILEYCRSDVTILREGCMKFRNLVFKITADDTGNGLDPFRNLTIASVCIAIFRTIFLEEEYNVTLMNLDSREEKLVKGYLQNGTWSFVVDGTSVNKEEIANDWEIKDKKFLSSPIASVPIHGSADTYSQASIVWLNWVAKQRNIKIQHALSPEGEFRIPGTHYKADGYCHDKKLILSYFGCVWHGCSQCFNKNRHLLKHPYTNQPFSEVFRATMERRRKLMELGYKFEYIWECQFLKKIKDNHDLRHFIEGLDIEERLDARDSFFGGRTNAAKLYHETQGDDKIKYIDFTSLYPFVNKTCKYPVGHPTILTGDGITEPVEHYFGIAKVKVLAPRGLYHPVLPYRSNGKLKFPLCRKCADTESQVVCECSDDDRMFVGTWCTPELAKAIQVGYHVLKIYEVYHWDNTTQYDVSTGKGGLFSGYINMFLKIKQEASGWPSWCETEVQKHEYINSYKRHEGIQLDYDKISKNNGLRSLAKLCLNSFWGKFGQRTNFPQTTIIHDSEANKFHQLLIDPGKTLLDFHILGEDLLSVKWEYAKESVPQSSAGNSNIYIATFTTCWARLKLYDALHLLQERVLYYDTDSVIFISRVGEPEPPLGDYLGDFTDELGNGDFITKFVSGGPKNYAYVTHNNDTVCKVRGFTLNHANSKVINFQTVLNEVLGVEQNVITKIPSKICRDSRQLKIYSKPENKKYAMVYTKRVVCENYFTYPYGY